MQAVPSHFQCWKTPIMGSLLHCIAAFSCQLSNLIQCLFAGGVTIERHIHTASERTPAILCLRKGDGCSSTPGVTILLLQTYLERGEGRGGSQHCVSFPLSETLFEMAWLEQVPAQPSQLRVPTSWMNIFLQFYVQSTIWWLQITYILNRFMLCAKKKSM